MHNMLTLRRSFAHNRGLTFNHAHMPDVSNRLNHLNRFNSCTFYTSAPVKALFARELAALAPIVSGIYGNHGLFLRAHAETPAALPAHLLGAMVDLMLVEQRFDGAARCEPGQLPFASESFKLLIVQHVFEQIDRPEECAAELARVLSPEGVILVLGFNPISLWRPWLALNARRDGSKLHLRSARTWQKMFAREQVDTLQVRYPGTFRLRAEHLNAAPQFSFLARTLGCMSSSWLLLARKRRSTLTPLRLRSAPRELALNPRLAPGAHRARA
jgi:SAM-dependent methyltransferase